MERTLHACHSWEGGGGGTAYWVPHPPHCHTCKVAQHQQLVVSERRAPRRRRRRPTAAAAAEQPGCWAAATTRHRRPLLVHLGSLHVAHAVDVVRYSVGGRHTTSVRHVGVSICAARGAQELTHTAARAAASAAHSCQRGIADHTRRWLVSTRWQVSQRPPRAAAAVKQVRDVVRGRSVPPATAAAAADAGPVARTAVAARRVLRGEHPVVEGVGGSLRAIGACGGLAVHDTHNAQRLTVHHDLFVVQQAVVGAAVAVAAAAAVRMASCDDVAAGAAGATAHILSCDVDVSAPAAGAAAATLDRCAAIAGCLRLASGGGAAVNTPSAAAAAAAATIRVRWQDLGNTRLLLAFPGNMRLLLALQRGQRHQKDLLQDLAGARPCTYATAAR
eukprot:15127-Chlamydomonas_euryale.AAC.2